MAETLFGGCKVDGFFLEYDSERSGDFQPLRFIKNQQVVPGPGNLQDPRTGKEADIVAPVQEASRLVPLEQLCLSPQCGFSSTEEGNLLTEEQQWAKLQLIKKIAEDVWADA